jgi:hypothetical protein
MTTYHFILNSFSCGFVIFSGIFGIMASFICYLLLRIAIGVKSEYIFTRHFFYSSVLTGIFERILFTLAIGLFKFEGSVISAAVGWIAIKGQLHYKIFTDKGIGQGEGLAKCYLGLLGSISSIVIAMIGGRICISNVTLDIILMMHKNALFSINLPCKLIFSLQ